MHIFKDQWKEIHDFIMNTWKVIEITANIRDEEIKRLKEEFEKEKQTL